jgi:hypothetical protein
LYSRIAVGLAATPKTSALCHFLPSLVAITATGRQTLAHQWVQSDVGETVPVVRSTRPRAEALHIWASINEKNLFENILFTRQRARLILRKGPEQRVETVAQRSI